MYRPAGASHYTVVPGAMTEALAETAYLSAGRACARPAVWTQRGGQGRVFDASWGRQTVEFSA